MGRSEGIRKKTYTRKDIEDKLYEKLVGKRLTKKLIVDSVLESVTEILIQSDSEARIELRDFGVFEVKKTKPKPKARNLSTGEFIYVPGRRKIHFRPGRVLREFLKKEIP